MTMSTAEINANAQLNDPTYPHNLKAKFEECGLNVFEDNKKSLQRWDKKMRKELPGYNGELLDDTRFRFLSIPYLRNKVTPALTCVMWVKVDGVWCKVIQFFSGTVALERTSIPTGQIFGNCCLWNSGHSIGYDVAVALHQKHRAPHLPPQFGSGYFHNILSYLSGEAIVTAKKRASPKRSAPNQRMQEEDEEKTVSKRKRYLKKLRQQRSDSESEEDSGSEQPLATAQWQPKFVEDFDAFNNIVKAMKV